jgi:predicted transposase YbfD/YdcC
LAIDRLANAARGHWGVESMHWLLDVEFKDDDLSRYRSGHGAKNMAIVRRFALCLAPIKPREASKHEENQQAGTHTISSSCSSSNDR